MKIECKTHASGIDILSLEGDFDFHAAAQVREALAKPIEKQAKTILVNLAKVGYIDSSGLAAFVEAFQKLKRTGGKLILFNLTPGVRSVFEIAKLDTIFKLADSEKQALTLI